MAPSRHRTEVLVSHEIKVAALLIMPVTALFIAAKTLIIDILYSSEFYDALAYVSLAIIGVGLRGASWCMAYAILARGDGKIYVLTELSSAAAYLLLNIPLYHYYGYAGLGAAYIAWYAVYTAVCYAVYRVRYGLRLRRGIPALILLSLAVGAAAWWLDSRAGIAAPAAIAIATGALAYKKLR